MAAATTYILDIDIDIDIELVYLTMKCADLHTWQLFTDNKSWRPCLVIL